MKLVDLIHFKDISNNFVPDNNKPVLPFLFDNSVTQ